MKNVFQTTPIRLIVFESLLCNRFSDGVGPAGPKGLPLPGGSLGSAGPSGYRDFEIIKGEKGLFVSKSPKLIIIACWRFD